MQHQATKCESTCVAVFAVEKGAALALVSVGWEPAPGTARPPEQPISACEVPPAQQLYAITLGAAQR